MVKTESWWVEVAKEGRRKFYEEVAQREEEWKRRQVGRLDMVGESLRQQRDIGPANKWQTHG